MDTLLGDIYFNLILILAFDGLLMAVLMWAVHSPQYSQYRIRTPETYRIPKDKKYKNVFMNSTISTVFIFGMIYLFHTTWVYAEAATIPTIFGETLAVLLVYDFMYYFLHRGMHYPKVMKYMHGVHHKVRFPTSIESIYLHPSEGLAGLSLLMIAFFIVGPISMVSFLAVLFFHSTVNILVHSNLQLPHPIFKLFNFWALKHDLHHGKHLDKNYASIFPFWDLMFDTYR